jgi:predicted enzyme related to lactoylglutathione lyase
VPERSEYAPGTPCWVELAAPDVARAVEFYSAVLGWDWDERDGGAYCTALVDEMPVAGLLAQPTALRPAGASPAWSSYVSVDDLAEAVAEAEAGGGSVAVPPTPVRDAGAMAMIVDPVGAALGLWQPASMAGAALVGEPGALIWSELLCSDCSGASEFYGALFGWVARPTPAPDGAEAYLYEDMDGVSVASVRDPRSGAPAMWLVYFACADADRCAEAIGAAGGAVAVGPVDAPVGRMGAAVDAVGAPFGFIAPSGSDSGR